MATNLNLHGAFASTYVMASRGEPMLVISRRFQRETGAEKWVVKNRAGNCLTKSGDWTEEPPLIARYGALLSQFCFDSLQDALDAANDVYSQIEPLIQQFKSEGPREGRA